MLVGKVIVDIRRSRGLKQKELATKASIPVTVLSKIENGKRPPGIKHLEKISKVLALPPEALLFLGLDEAKVSEEKRPQFRQMHELAKEVFLNEGKAD